METVFVLMVWLVILRTAEEWRKPGGRVWEGTGGKGLCSAGRWLLSRRKQKRGKEHVRSREWEILVE